MKKGEIVENLFDIGAVFLSPKKPFTWASGIKSPIYCDNRLILSFPKIRKKIEACLSEIVKENFSECEILAGTSTAGIAHAAFIACDLDLPMVYVRGNEKDHGRKNLIEGKIEPNQNTVVIEDLISTAGSVINVVKILRKAQANVLGIVSIFTYGMKASLEALTRENTKNFSLLSYDDLIETALKRRIISESDFKGLKFFRDDPKNPGWMDLI
ncbi:MAG: orotate phosphoribosyltransferase [Oscillospiraceae bacterium]|jgi:orotate phosphoribosyltransferase|nr:orotate phosphoribosyltransferase [Oscillospiraceae bacterium]